MLILPDVPPYFTSPRYDDRVVQELQQDFATNLSWLERSYHIARIGVDSDTKLTYPQIQANNSNKNTVYNIRPDDRCKAYSYFYVEEPYETDYNEGDLKCFLSVTFWGHLTLIDGANTQDFTSQLIQDVVKRLKIKQAYNVRVEERPEKIFDKYTWLKQESNQHLMRKYTAFKIDFEILRGFVDEC